MTHKELLSQANDLVSVQPKMVASELLQGVQIKGIYSFSRTEDDVPLWGDYSVTIFVSDTFPMSFPEIRETEGKIPKDFQHFMSGNGAGSRGGSLCLGAPCDLIDCLVEEPTIVHYVTTLLDSYLYAVEYFIRYHTVPDYGERSHGVYGKLEAYSARYNTNDPNVLMRLLVCLSNDHASRGDSYCPYRTVAGNRDCHGCQVFEDKHAWYSGMLRQDTWSTLQAWRDVLRR